MASSGRRLHRRVPQNNDNGNDASMVTQGKNTTDGKHDEPRPSERRTMKRQNRNPAPVVDDNGLDEYIDDEAQHNHGRNKPKKQEADKDRLPADYVGGIDPLAIVALFFSAVPIVGLALGFLSYRRYRNKIYDDGRFLAIIAIIIGLLALIGMALGVLAMHGLMEQFSMFQNGMGNMSMDANGDTYMSSTMGTME